MNGFEFMNFIWEIFIVPSWKKYSHKGKLKPRVNEHLKCLYKKYLLGSDLQPSIVDLICWPFGESDFSETDDFRYERDDESDGGSTCDDAYDSPDDELEEVCDHQRNTDNQRDLRLRLFPRATQGLISCRVADEDVNSRWEAYVNRRIELMANERWDWNIRYNSYYKDISKK